MRAQKGYIRGVADAKYNIVLEGGKETDNANFITVKNRNDKIIYTSKELTEYGFYNGPKYVSKEFYINGKKRVKFLEVVFDKSMKLYYYHDARQINYKLEKSSDSTKIINSIEEASIKVFFLEKDDSLYLLSPENFNEELQKIVNYSPERKIYYNRKSLSDYLKISRGESVKKSVELEFGSFIGVSNINNLNIDSNLKGLNTNWSFSKQVGIRTSFKLLEQIYFGIGLNILWEKFNFEYLDNSTFLLDLDFKTIQVPVYLKIQPEFMNKFYIKAGIQFSYAPWVSNNIYEIKEFLDGVLINPYDLYTDIENNHLGISCTFGYDYSINNSTLFSEFTYSNGLRQGISGINRMFNNGVGLRF